MKHLYLVYKPKNMLKNRSLPDKFGAMFHLLHVEILWFEHPNQILNVKCLMVLSQFFYR